MSAAVGAGRRVRAEGLVTLAFAVLKALSVILLIRIAEGAFTGAILGLFLLARRVSATVPSLTGLGITNTLKRYIPINATAPGVARDFIRVGSLLVTGANVLLISVYLLSPRTLTHFFLGESSLAEPRLGLWTIVLCVALAFHFTLFGTLMGQRRVLMAQLADLMAVGVWPIGAFWVLGGAATPAGVLRIHALALLATTLPVLLFFSLPSGRPAEEPVRWRDVMPPILGYGLSRSGVTFADALLVTLGPWLIRSESESAGYLLIALTLLRLGSVALSALTSVAAVSIAGLLGRGDHKAVRLGINLMLGFVILFGVIGLAVGLPLAERVLLGWLTSAESARRTLPVTHIVLLAMPLFTIFHGLKGIVDVQDVRPWNLISLVVANFTVIIAFFALRNLMTPLLAVGLGVTIGHLLLGCATVWILRRHLYTLSYFRPTLLLLAGGVSGAIALAANHLLPTMQSLFGLAATLAVGGLAAGSGAACYLFLSSTGCPAQLRAVACSGGLSRAEVEWWAK